MQRTPYYIVTLIAVLCLGAATTACKEKPAEQELTDKDKELAELRQLAEMDRREMENQYADFARQYDEMKQTVQDKSLLEKLDKEQQRAEALLKEIQALKKDKNASAAEILRLKKELETVRAVLREYVRQVDSLQRINQTLTTERDEARADAERQRQENSGLSEQNQKLNETVNIAAQLNATGVSVSPHKKNGKAAKKSKDVKSFTVSFAIARNVTARTGNRTVYVRMLKPGQTVLSKAGTFQYEGKSIEYSAAKTIEYTGQETRVSLHIPVGEFVTGGSYAAYIFCDGRMIGSGSVTLEK